MANNKPLSEYTNDELRRELNSRHVVLGCFCWEELDVQLLSDELDLDLDVTGFIREHGGEFGYFCDRMNELAREFVETLA